MRANEFIKKYGLDRAKKLLSITSKMNMSGLVFANLEDGDNLDFEVDELKRLIESHELVENLGGLNEAKGEFFEIVHSGCCVEVSPSALREAIADVESCQ